VIKGFLKKLLAKAVRSINCRLPLRVTDTGNSIPILCYHRVLPDFFETNYQVFSISPEQFEAQAAFLAEAGFTSLALQEYAEIARGMLPPPPRSVLITFDDGFADNYAVAWQIAQKYNLIINFFICTEIIGKENPVLMGRNGYRELGTDGFAGESASIQLHIGRFPQLWRPLNWPELNQMRHAGVGFGLHGHTHRSFSRLTPAEIVDEIETGLAIFKREMGYSPQFYALPYGGYDSLTPDITNILRHFDQNLIFGTHIGRARLPSTQVIFPRISIFQHDNLDTFQSKILGNYDWVGKLCWVLSRVQLRLR
jgi:peptidoglycan/xylan/chitin deacetylase (PgdA/CDA1 family)